MPYVRLVSAHLLTLCSIGAFAGASHARVVRAPKPPPATIPAADAEDVPRTIAVPMPGTSLVRGRSTVVVRAPLDRVRATVLDFGRYAEFMPHYEACRLLGRTSGGGRDVYMRVVALRGAVKLWARIEVARPTMEAGAETYRSRLVDGNVRDLQATWRVSSVDGASTRLEVEIFLRPKLPLPASIVNDENLRGARLAVMAFKTRAEGK